MFLKVMHSLVETLMNYVKQEPAINLFIIGDIEQFGVDVDFQEAYLQYRNEEITACILRYYSNVVVYSHLKDFDVKEVADLIQTFDFKIISGKKTVMDLLLPQLKDYKEYNDFYFCKCEKTDQLEEVTLSIKNAVVSDVKRIHKLIDMVGFYPNNYIESNTRKLESKAGRIYFIDENEEVISSAGTSIETSVSAMIGGVSTHPDYRNKGYASQIVSKLAKDLLEEGKIPCLFFNNPKAGSIYHRLGFIDIDMWSMAKFI